MFYPLDLQPLANQKRKDDFHQDNLPGNNLEALTSGVPGQAIPFLGARLRAARPAATERRVGLLLTQLDDDDFAVREKATRELAKLGPEALPLLRRSLDGSSSLEARHRIERLLANPRTAAPTADQKRLQAAVIVLELTATAEARRLLEEVSRGSAGAWLAPTAQASLKRLGEKKD